MNRAFVADCSIKYGIYTEAHQYIMKEGAEWRRNGVSEDTMGIRPPTKYDSPIVTALA